MKAIVDAGCYPEGLERALLAFILRKKILYFRRQAVRLLGECFYGGCPSVQMGGYFIPLPFGHECDPIQTIVEMDAQYQGEAK